MSDSPHIYISCTQEDLAEAVSLYQGLRTIGFQTSMGVFGRGSTYLFDSQEDDLPGESLETIRQR
jgi:hypothetical protein